MSFESVGSEVWRARQGKDVVRVTKQIKLSNETTIDIDIVEHGEEHWVEVKNPKQALCVECPTCFAPIHKEPILETWKAPCRREKIFA